MSPVGILGIPRGLKKICVVLLVTALLIPFIERNGPNASVLHHFGYRQKKTIGGGKAERFPNSGTALLQKQNAVVALMGAFFGEMVLRDARTSLVDHSSLQKIEFSGDTVPRSGKIVPGRIDIVLFMDCFLSKQPILHTDLSCLFLQLPCRKETHCSKHNDEYTNRIKISHCCSPYEDDQRDSPSKDKAKLRLSLCTPAQDFPVLLSDRPDAR